MGYLYARRPPELPEGSVEYVAVDPAARARGNPAVDGLGMLLHQARPGFAAWFGRDPDVDEALRQFVLAGLAP